MLWLILRRLTRGPAKFFFLLLSICVLVLLFYQLWLMLKKHNTHPHYVYVIEGYNGEIISYNRIANMDGVNGQQLGKSTELLCLNAYLTLVSGSTVDFPICIHEPTDDKYISLSMFHGFLYEHEYIQILMDYLRQEPNLGLLDIGANLGVYTLPAAHMGRHVIAVEALPQNILRLKTSVELGHIQQQVQVIKGAVSNSHEDLYAITWKLQNNIGGTQMVEKAGCLFPECDTDKPIKAIFMDDLLDFIPFKKGVMKIDIEGYEMYAFEQSSKLLDAVHFTVILMEWKLYGHYIYVPSMWEPVKKFIKLFTDRDYMPCDILSGKVLSQEEWDKWPMQIMWKKID